MFGLRNRRKIKNTPVKTLSRRWKPMLETLEDRTVPTISFSGSANWLEQGARPFLSAQLNVIPNDEATGAIESVTAIPEPGNPALYRVFVSTVNGGIWRANNVDPANPAAVAWTPLTDFLPSLSTSSIRFSPLDPTGNTLFAGTGSFSSLSQTGGPAIGVLRSTDGGTNWTAFPLLGAGTQPQVKTVLPTTLDAAAAGGTQQLVLIATTSGGSNGLFRSNDGGLTYTAISGTLGLPAGDVSQLIVDPNNPQQFYAGVPGQGVYSGVFDPGTFNINWTAVNTGITGAGTAGNIQVTAHDAGASTVLYALVSGAGLSAYRSVNGGANWTTLATPPIAYNRDNVTRAGNNMIADPTNNQVVYISTYGGGSLIHRYDPTGMGSWVSITGANTASNTTPHADYRDMEFLGTNTLLATNDGGIYLMNNPLTSNTSDWNSFIGTGTNAIGSTELHNVAWDSRFNVIVAAAQDNGTSVQTATGNILWDHFNGGDGADVAIDEVTLGGAGQSARYVGTQNIGSFNRYIFDSATNVVSNISILPAGGFPNLAGAFIPIFEISNVGPAAGQSKRLIVAGSGTSPLYEATNAATAANAAAVNWAAIPVNASLTSVNCLTYGGRLGGVDNPEVLYVGSGSTVYLRSTVGGTVNPTAAAFPGGTVQDITLDPNDWQHAFVLDGNGRVYETINAGASWTNRSGNLVLSIPQTIEYVEAGVVDAVLVGGLGGVYRMLTNAQGSWTEFGANIPNAISWELDFDATDNVLVVSTFGRGAWIINNATTVALQTGTLTITGDMDFANEIDTILVRRVAGDPNLLEVVLNGTTFGPYQYSLINNIVVNSLGNADSLIVDHSNGRITIPIDYDGGTGGPDTLTVQGNSGGNFNQLIYTVTTPGAGSVNLDGNIINFVNLTPVIVTSIAGTTTITNASVLNGTTTDLSDAPGAGLNQVVFNGGLESLVFANPTVALNVNGNNLDDTITLLALDAAFAAATITIDAGDGQDLIQILAKPNSAVLNTNTNSGTPNDRTIIGNTWANFQLDNDLGSLANINGTVNANDSGGVGQVYVDDSSNAAGTTGTVTSTAITVGAKTFNYNGMNVVQLRTGLGDDNYMVLSSNAGAITTLFLNAGADTATIKGAGVSGILVVNGDEGNDTFYVTPSPFAPIFINGGLPVAGDPGVPPGDRLIDCSFGGTVIPLNSPDGSIITPGFNPINFTSIESVIIADRFEINNTPAQATFLGSDPTVALMNLSINCVDDPATANVNEADVDFFRYVAHNTGYLTINAQYQFSVGGALRVDVYRPTSVANLTTATAFNNDTNYVLGPVPTVVGDLDGSRLNIPVVKGQVYYIRIRGVNQLTDVNNYNLELENFAAAVPTVVNLPANLPGSAIGTNDNDTGRSNTDSITNNSAPYFIIQADLRDLADAGVVMLTAAQATAGQTAGASVQVYVRTFAGVPITSFFAEPIAGSNNTLWGVRTTSLPDGNYQVTASTIIFDNNSPNGLANEVKRSGLTQFGSPPLNFTIDTVAPASPSFVLNPLDDTGIPGQPNTYIDNITKNHGANFTGNAEAAAWMQFYAVDRNAIPQFGGTAYSNAFGQYFIDPTFNLNDPTFFDLDGERLMFSTATDVAGNVSAPQTLLIFLDTRGPQVAGVTYRYDVNGNVVVVDLLNQTVDGVKVALPQINYIDVTLIDQPNRTDLFLYPAANPRDPNLPGLATTPGNYAIIGQKTGNQTIQSVVVLEDFTTSGSPGQTTYRLFLAKPLPEDKFTFKVFDRIQDEAGNALDGDFQPPILPSGDGVPGGNFVIQFITVDSRAELGFYANGSANIDLNGDFVINPGSNVGDDAIIPYAPNGGAVFAGQFYDPNIGTVDGFDRLGTYGKQGTKYVFRLDFNNDGDFSDPGETTIQTKLQINGLPIAGNWGPSAVNILSGLLTGSNVGVFDGTTWYLDTNGNNIIENAAAGDRVLKGNMKGLPFTGDFDGDGLTDLGTYLNGVFYLDLTFYEAGGLVTGFTNYTFRAALPLATSGTASKLARPVAADFDGDGITDIGLFIPNQTTVPSGQANWFLMNSNYTPWDIAVPSGSVRGFKNAATGFGNDVAATYGSAKALPVVGNFDPSQNLKPAAKAAAKAAAQAANANLAHNLADMYFQSNDSTDFATRQLRKGRGR